MMIDTQGGSGLSLSSGMLSVRTWGWMLITTPAEVCLSQVSHSTPSPGQPHRWPSLYSAQSAKGPVDTRVKPSESCPFLFLLSLVLVLSSLVFFLCPRACLDAHTILHWHKGITKEMPKPYYRHSILRRSRQILWLYWYRTPDRACLPLGSRSS